MAATKVPIELEHEVLKKISWIAKKQKHTLNYQLGLAVQQYIKDYEAANGTVQVEFENSDFR